MVFGLWYAAVMQEEVPPSTEREIDWSFVRRIAWKAFVPDLLQDNPRNGMEPVYRKLHVLAASWEYAAMVAAGMALTGEDFQVGMGALVIYGVSRASQLWLESNGRSGEGK
jgi:hypothetical protein